MIGGEGTAQFNQEITIAKYKSKYYSQQELAQLVYKMMIFYEEVPEAMELCMKEYYEDKPILAKSWKKYRFRHDDILKKILSRKTGEVLTPAPAVRYYTDDQKTEELDVGWLLDKVKFWQHVKEAQGVRTYSNFTGRAPERYRQSGTGVADSTKRQAHSYVFKP
jgi:hypothetical protein